MMCQGRHDTNQYGVFLLVALDYSHIALRLQGPWNLELHSGETGVISENASFSDEDSFVYPIIVAHYKLRGKNIFKPMH